MLSLGLHELTSSQHFGSWDFGQEVLATALLSTNWEEKAILKVANFCRIVSDKGLCWGAWGGSGLPAPVLLREGPSVCPQSLKHYLICASPPQRSRVALRWLQPSFSPSGIELFWTGGRRILCWNSLSLAVLQGTRQYLFIWFSSCLVSLVFGLFCFVRFFFSSNFHVSIPWTSFLFSLLAGVRTSLKGVCLKQSQMSSLRLICLFSPKPDP